MTKQKIIVHCCRALCVRNDAGLLLLCYSCKYVFLLLLQRSGTCPCSAWVNCWFVTTETHTTTKLQRIFPQSVSIISTCLKKEQYFSPWEPIKDKGLEYRERVGVLKLTFCFGNRFIAIFYCKVCVHVYWSYFITYSARNIWISLWFSRLLYKWVRILKLFVKITTKISIYSLYNFVRSSILYTLRRQDFTKLLYDTFCENFHDSWTKHQRYNSLSSCYMNIFDHICLNKNASLLMMSPLF